MEESESSPYWLKAVIELDPVLEEAVSEYLVGVLGAGVEQAADTVGPSLCLNVFMEEKNLDAGQRQELQDNVKRQLDELAAIFEVSPPHISWEQIEDQDWSSNWKVHFKPFAIVPGLVIAPTWEEYQAKEGEKVIVMDPGMAFGTGHHGTTALSLAFVQEIVSQGKGDRVLDVGTGTGILGMGAALFGASRVLAIDNDPEAVRAASENVVLNKLESVMEVTLTPLDQVKTGYDLIIANIIHDVLLTMSDDFSRLLTSGGNLVLSGLLHGEQEENIIRVFEGIGFVLQGREQQDEWAALWFAASRQ
ncbi:MAG: 50S ribosomal protein L11 methyltransferase [Proteobacteria bacterium]|nr:50S ribosomal protein L11 methyltransferase [Pseudomonadota bacterium]MBU1233493.1 50S ribosomal protein L11 methyltransferase [Pseudomonadota bacterium]MBU1418764.1 50S ribosomal protein L11 methyltransferase [Pseudomonadota bacterium]MBU1455472.1 50S ribosomal protein L11 methyltransferase [Pseudomonadota bacterium]